jgi:hypothetical protein
MNGHPNGCQCEACKIGRRDAAPTTITTGTYAYAAPIPGGWFPHPAPPSEPYPVVALYMVVTPDQAFPRPGITWTPAPESPEMVELRKLREDIAKLARSQDGMRKLVERFLAKGKVKK